MKNYLLTICLFALTFIDLSAAGMKPAEYQNAIVGQQNKIVKKMLGLTKAFESKDPNEIEIAKRLLIEQSEASVKVLDEIIPFKNDFGLLENMKELFKFYGDIAKNEYRELADMMKKGKENISPEDLQRIDEIQKSISSKEKNIEKKSLESEEKFVKFYKILVVKDTPLQKEIDAMNERNRLKDEALLFNNSIIGEQTAIMNKMIELSGSFERREPKEMNNLIGSLDNQIARSLKTVQKIKPVKEGSDFKNAAVKLFSFYKDLSQKQFKEIVAILSKYDDGISNDDINRHNLLNQEIADKEKKMNEEFGKVQKSFAKEYGFEIVHNEMQNRIDSAGAPALPSALDYYNAIIVIQQGITSKIREFGSSFQKQDIKLVDSLYQGMEQEIHRSSDILNKMEPFSGSFELRDAALDLLLGYKSIVNDEFREMADIVRASKFAVSQEQYDRISVLNENLKLLEKLLDDNFGAAQKKFAKDNGFMLIEKK